MIGGGGGGVNRNAAESNEGKLAPAIFETQGRMGTLFAQETQRLAQLFAKKHCDGGEFEEATVQTAFLKR